MSTVHIIGKVRRERILPLWKETAATVDTNRVVAGMSDLLRRTLSETFELEAVLAAGLWSTLADQNQLENAVLNLVNNARDAMPEGGKITIETANTFLDEAYVERFGDVTSGQYVLLSIADNAKGIPPEAMEHMFEPFFTTKQVGKGTGLASGRAATSPV